ncbi:MAG: hypothetical protein FWC66_10110, partial [Oscillospiraceae bacterium]|nr:hypothetical protein [Oscillospiraceae bacterium]
SHKLRQDGYQVKCFNTACFCTSVGYNPFVYAQSGVNITKFVGAFVSGTEGCEAPDSLHLFLLKRHYSPHFSPMCQFKLRNMSGISALSPKC